MEPFALEFINNSIYATQEFVDICGDNSSDWFWLIRAITPILQDKVKADQLINGLSDAVQKLPKRFWLQFIHPIFQSRFNLFISHIFPIINMTKRLSHSRPVKFFLFQP